MARRRARLLAALGTVVLALATGGCDLVRQPGERAGETDTGSGESLYSGLPAQIAAGADTPDLPSDRAVGPAAFIYTSHDQGSPIYLVTVDGTPYRLGSQPDQVGPANMTLSPDGRWFARRRGDRWTVRDLTSTVEHSVVGDNQVLDAWSVDGRSALWHVAAPPGQRHFQLMNTQSGQMTDLAFTDSVRQNPLVLLNDHELAIVDYLPLMDDEKRFSIEVVDVRSGATVRSTSIDLAAHLKPGEHLVAYLIPLLYVNGNPARLWTTVTVMPTTQGPEATSLTAVGVMGVDLGSGQFLARLDWPEPRKGDVTYLAGAGPDGAVLVRLTDAATEISIVSDGGERRIVTRLPGGTTVFPAGRQF